MQSWNIIAIRPNGEVLYLWQGVNGDSLVPNGISNAASFTSKKQAQEKRVELQNKWKGLSFFIEKSL